MNKIMSTVALSVFAVMLAGCSANNDKTVVTVKSINEIAPYPQAEEGYTRSIIYLPELKNEQNAKVELMIGKDMLVDCNLHRLSGSISQQELKGWGYQYYVVNSNNNGISTLMACPLDVKEKMEFVTINNNLDLINYNSRLPIVVYAPSDLKVKYRIWSATNEVKSAVIE
ncbi:serine protease inhibitor ecotin [Orbus mooreae]|uniref:serine protease inhibitor ecotin n=1 Tax=Orbus mooreae TaxID=3074107 RepID=UPI00370DA67C